MDLLSGISRLVREPVSGTLPQGGRPPVEASQDRQQAIGAKTAIIAERTSQVSSTGEYERLHSLISHITRADAAEIIALTQPLEDAARASISTAMAAYGEANGPDEEASSRPFGAPHGGFRTI